ncbi:bifunctional dethiobiotin synthetase/adenosylmethionine-8-amino-7-oxononanoate aminotransferase [Amniculicola lignicola CBS 123094]|uniref:Bifunctional dethiobiotin synthetase/adenosylmethionine-8-amino-7-oxononanoate aminotransferase n=1 Tax=Amniculicola lignicola CBS 123094 TaxID=1392246 RepID=A0A6A5W6V6_9PLEO|nr:bifunctional dethiobiotin synthetase/adenosylmethionine-8-amino-7-oxononanoate aminotransferase [Amniculicola lignicola CBS 123094]
MAYPGGLWTKLLALQVYGANTGVGKTVASTILLKHFMQKGIHKPQWKDNVDSEWRVNYIKPVSTGKLDDADERYVGKYARCRTSTLVQYDDPLSPHVAAVNAKRIVYNDVILSQLTRKLSEQPRSLAQNTWGVTLVETAGGVMSPGPSGTPQADIFRPLRLPVILVGDHRLGGIASTISAFESLTIRGYDVDAVIIFEANKNLGNFAYLEQQFARFEIKTFELPWIPDLENCTPEEEGKLMKAYYEGVSKDLKVGRIAQHLLSKRQGRVANIKTLADRTKKAIWHPFTQHQTSTEDVLVFDSAYKDFFQVKHTPATKGFGKSEVQTPILGPMFDGSASWWTQGLGHGNPMLSLNAAYAAGRYGHVMFAGATHKPALELAERLMKQLENPRMKKVFYTDDGSTAVEVGLKMALRAACKRYGWEGSTEPVGVIGLKGSYHGDTIGAMDASEPSVYNKNVDWYRGRGYWFDYPQVKLRKGTWIVEPPADMADQAKQEFENLNDVFNFKARGKASHYEEYITKTLDTLVKEQGRKFGALIMEPVILGAGGMIFVDPLFQQTLVKVIRNYDFGPTPKTADEHAWTGLPVVFDEVFTGLYRLGRASAASFLQIFPDISIHAKLLTGGILPLSATLASQSIFEAFLGDSKAEALLHGHSYTAHPIGCHVAITSLKMMRANSQKPHWKHYQDRWTPRNGDAQPIQVVERDERENSAATDPLAPPPVWSMWTKKTVDYLSHLPQVDHVVALGSVLAIALRDAEGSGYTSNAAAGLRDKLLATGNMGFGIHSRVLGNVIYLMAGINSRPATLEAVERALKKNL